MTIENVLSIQNLDQEDESPVEDDFGFGVRAEILKSNTFWQLSFDFVVNEDGEVTSSSEAVGG